MEEQNVTNAIFIGGCDRSGTTMLGSILGSATGCFTTPESQFKTRVLTDSGLLHGTWPEVARRIQAMWHMDLWSIPDKALVQILTKDAPTTGADLLQSILKAYLYHHGVLPNKTTWIDHSPINFISINCLIDAFPNAKFVHIVRDGRAVAASMMKVPWGPNTYDRCANFWARSLAPGLAAELAYPDRVYRIRYEDVVENPKHAIESLASRLDIEFVDQMIEGGTWTVPHSTATNHKLVGSAPDPTRAESWRLKISEQELHAFERRTGDLLAMLGYERLICGDPSSARWRVWLWALQEAVAYGANQIQKRWRKTFAA